MLPYLMITPAMIIMAVFVIYPIFYMIYLSFFDWNMMSEMKYVGTRNYQRLIEDADFRQVIGNTFKYVGWTVALSVFFGLLSALYLKANTKINTFLQGAMFIPHVVSLVSISFIWMWLMEGQYGLLNYLLSVVGIDPIRWLEDPQIALNSIIIISVWKSIGYNTIIIISALHAVPEYLYQAASLDKASKITTFFKITLPMISPSLFFLVLMNLISAFKVFEPINIITKGGPMNSTNTLVHMIYEEGFQFYKIGYASSMGVVLMVILSICTLVYFKMLSKRVHYR
ncbi:MAG: ABC transporter permease [Epulopiscium sp. Nele67-Bin005]|nr:MAG: ABC transporter permease [Epulopiscium sp. Nele67-Bin005]